MREVTFYVGTNKTVSSEVSKTFTFQELDIDESLKGEELQEELNEALLTWMWENIYTDIRIKD